MSYHHCVGSVVAARRAIGEAVLALLDEGSPFVIVRRTAGVYAIGDETTVRMVQPFPVRLCEECGKPFEVRDRRMRFCPPPPGLKDSRCCMRHLKRRARAKAGE